MQEEHEQLDRRGFLRPSGAGAVVAGTKAFFPPMLFAERQPLRLQTGLHLLIRFAFTRRSLRLCLIETMACR